MPLYTVLSPPPKAGESQPDPVRFVFVKDGFCWPALFIPELWLLYRRMWLALLIYLAGGLGLGVVAAEVGGPLPWVALGLAHLLFALEGNALRRWKLTAHGHEFVGVAEGRRRDAELRFFNAWQPPTPAAPAAPPAAPPAMSTTMLALAPPKSAGAAPSVEAGDVVGLFPSPAVKP
jgi:Protein of unknown function (DUF2628)